MRRSVDPSLVARHKIMLAYCTALSDLKRLYEYTPLDRDARIDDQIARCQLLKDEMIALRNQRKG